MSLLDRLLPHPADTTHAEAVANGSRVVVYWRAGCPFCVRLRRAVRREADRAAWVDIWRDPEGAAYVRSVNHGNETVPTVVIDGVPHTNPPPRMVRDALLR